jgi:sugar phosphate isomerase/epimerase
VQWSGRLILAAGSMLDQPATTLIDAAAAAGFNGVDLRLSGEHGGAPLAELRQHAERAGLAIFGAEVYRISTLLPRSEQKLCWSCRTIRAARRR